MYRVYSNNDIRVKTFFARSSVKKCLGIPYSYINFPTVEHPVIYYGTFPNTYIILDSTLMTEAIDHINIHMPVYNKFYYIFTLIKKDYRHINIKKLLSNV